jgi:hypothetical protein
MTAPTGAPEMPGPAGRPPVRLVLVPTPQPPLEDERHPLRLVLPGISAPRPAHRPGPRPRTDHGPARPDDFGPSWSVRADLPDPRDAGRRLITCTLEALAGRRPIVQLQPMTSMGVFTALSGGRRPRWCAEGTSPLLIGALHGVADRLSERPHPRRADRQGRGLEVSCSSDWLRGRTCTSEELPD